MEVHIVYAFYIIAGYLFTAVFGTLSHFLYDCSGQNLFIALFAPVNESIWEHMKLSFSRCFYMRFFCLISDSRKKNFIRSVTPCYLEILSERSAFPYFFTPIPEYWDVISLPQISPSFCSVFSLLSDSHGKERIRSGQTAGENGFIY